MQGALVVEMECTALMAVATYRGVEFGAVLVVTDELFGQRWHTAFDAEAVRAVRRTACEAVGRGIRSKLK